MDDLGDFGRRSVVLMVGEGEMAEAVSAPPSEFIHSFPRALT